jgi:hypothetical protein
MTITPKMVSDWIEEAVLIERRLPSPSPKDAKSSWPKMTAGTSESCGCHPPDPPLLPLSQADLARLDECQGWMMQWLSRMEVYVVWQRASKTPWEVIRKRVKQPRTTLLAIRVRAIATIAMQLNNKG